ncbi:hypothetical protein BGZ70_005862 [Mortierella alpina]|uniref:Uncharacterized protein n=1 Tax=Mortierella alpina TaxID=64518 RepID=A0A9P6J8M5_MORAP|nr:hypothetical protein BGZ70_005862 [Mortierella alpina]
MFVPWSFFQMYFFFFFLQILLSSALGAALALYSRSHQGYAHAIRWVRQSGYVEMLKAINTSRGKLPETIIRALSMVVFVSIVISIADTGAKVFVKQAIRQTNVAQQIIQSTPFIKADTVAKMEGWTTTVRPRGSIADALAATVNSSRNIPDAQPGREYIPQQYPYEPACDRLTLIPMDRNHSHLQVSNNGCADLTIYNDNFFKGNISRSYVTRRSEGRGTIVLLGHYQKRGSPKFDSGASSVEMAAYVQISTPDGRDCYTADMHHNVLVPTQSGLTYSPTTLVTKCLYATGDIITLSSTSIRFSVPKLQSFHKVVSSIFEQQDDLLVGMEQSISNGLFSRLAAANVSDGMHVIEVQTTGTEVRALTCAARRAGQNGTVYLMCSYTTAAATLTKPQPMLPEIAARRAGQAYVPYNFYSVDIMVEHLPFTSNSGSGQLRYATTSILNASKEAAMYFASLGQNLNVDWKGRKVLLIFETVDKQKGYEIPLWLFAVVIGLMTGSLLLVGSVEASIETKFKRSLHWMVSKELEPTLGRKAPTLMRF